jgi:hypothetical protein
MHKAMELMKKPFSRNPLVRRIVSYGLALIALTMIFMSYYAPDMMVAMTNQVWAFCGW